VLAVSCAGCRPVTTHTRTCARAHTHTQHTHTGGCWQRRTPGAGPWSCSPPSGPVSVPPPPPHRTHAHAHAHAHTRAHARADCLSAVTATSSAKAVDCMPGDQQCRGATCDAPASMLIYRLQYQQYRGVHSKACMRTRPLQPRRGVVCAYTPPAGCAAEVAQWRPYPVPLPLCLSLSPVSSPVSQGKPVSSPSPVSQTGSGAAALVLRAAAGGVRPAPTRGRSRVHL
jgi:hypothetical protein